MCIHLTQLLNCRSNHLREKVCRTRVWLSKHSKSNEPKKLIQGKHANLETNNLKMFEHPWSIITEHRRKRIKLKYSLP